MSGMEESNKITYETAIESNYTTDEKEENCILDSICKLLESKGFRTVVDADYNLGCDTTVLVYATRKY